MDKNIIWLILLLLFAGCIGSLDTPPVQVTDPSVIPRKAFRPNRERYQIEYFINNNDTLEVFVWKNPDLSRDVIVRPDGKISLPLAGDIDAAGQTLIQLDKKITQKLSAYIRDPQVSVAIKKFEGEKVFVLGEVKSPGVQNYVGRASLIEIVSQSGGFTKHAKLGEILVIRGNIDKPEIIRIDVKKIRQGNLSANIMVQPGDIIWVSSTAIADIGQYLRDYITPVLGNLVNIEYLRRR